MMRFRADWPEVARMQEYPQRQRGRLVLFVRRNNGKEVRRRINGKLYSVALLLTLSSLIFGGCTTSTPEPVAGLANPASVHCEEQGYTLEMRTDEKGTYGVCIFPDGSECEEWAFYGSECSPGSGKIFPTEAPVAPTDPSVLMPDPAGAQASAP